MTLESPLRSKKKTQKSSARLYGGTSEGLYKGTSVGLYGRHDGIWDILAMFSWNGIGWGIGG